MVRATRFERRGDKMISRRRFAARMARAAAIWLGLTAVSRMIGMVGHGGLEGMSATDAFVNAAMILSGMGPVGTLNTVPGKIFAGCYALASGLVIIVATDSVLAPIFHRVLHHFHVETKGES